MKNWGLESVELSTTDLESLERSAITIVESISKEQRRAILDRMDRTYLNLARKYGHATETGGHAWGVAMGKALRILVADIERWKVEGSVR
jgi:hypothetical protein